MSAWSPVDDRLFAWDGALEPGAPIALLASHCEKCNRYEFPVRETCPSCGAPTSSVRLSRTARVSQWTAVNHAPPGGLVEVPYNVAIVDFPEGVSVLGLVSKDGSGEVVLGNQVEVVAAGVGEKIGYAFSIIEQ